MPDLLKLLVRNLVMGIAAGWITLAALFATDMGGLLGAVTGSSNPLLPILLLAFGFALTFGSLAMGAAIMMLPYGKNDGNDRGLKIHNLMSSLKNLLPRFSENRHLVPVPVKDKRQSQHQHYSR